MVPKLMQVYFRTEFTHLNYVSFHTQFKFITVTLLWVVPSAFPGAALAAGKAGALCPKQLCFPRRLRCCHMGTRGLLGEPGNFSHGFILL